MKNRCKDLYAQMLDRTEMALLAIGRRLAKQVAKETDHPEKIGGMIDAEVTRTLATLADLEVLPRHTVIDFGDCK